MDSTARCVSQVLARWRSVDAKKGCMTRIGRTDYIIGVERGKEEHTRCGKNVCNDNELVQRRLEVARRGGVVSQNRVNMGVQQASAAEVDFGDVAVLGQKDRRLSQSYYGISGTDAACGWAVVKLNYDKEEEPLHTIYGTMLAGLEVQKTITRAEQCAFTMALSELVSPSTIHTDNMGF